MKDPETNPAFEGLLEAKKTYCFVEFEIGREKEKIEVAHEDALWWIWRRKRAKEKRNGRN